MKLIYLDIDGVVLPQRAYLLPGQTTIVRLFDPCAVSILNRICEETGALIVLHSTWIYTNFWNAIQDSDVVGHCISQGIKEEYFFHEAPYCERNVWMERHERINLHINTHQPEQVFIFDDEDLSAHFGDDFYKCDFEVGISWQHFMQICGDLDNIKTG